MPIGLMNGSPDLSSYLSRMVALKAMLRSYLTIVVVGSCREYDPVACVYHEAVGTHCWPDKGKQEKQILISKCQNPTMKDDMRNLGLSPFLNKDLEQVLVE